MSRLRVKRAFAAGDGREMGRFPRGELPGFSVCGWFFRVVWSDLGELSPQADAGSGCFPLAFVAADAQVRNLVAQGVAMDSQAARRATVVPVVGAQGGRDELPFEFLTSLLQGQSLADQLIDDLMQSAVVVLSVHSRFTLLEQET